MIVFEQIRNATVKLHYSGVIFMIDPWLMDACEPSERNEALTAHRFIPKPVCPLPDKAEKLIKDTDVFLLTHFHPDHFSSDYLPADARIVCGNETAAARLKDAGFVNVQRFEDETIQFPGDDCIPCECNAWRQ